MEVVVVVFIFFIEDYYPLICMKWTADLVCMHIYYTYICIYSFFFLSLVLIFNIVYKKSTLSDHN